MTKCKPGEYERGTYFCGQCQDNSLKTGPCKNSLIGWASGVSSFSLSLSLSLSLSFLTLFATLDIFIFTQLKVTSSTWKCEACTFENKPGSVSCFACGSSKAKRKSTESPGTTHAKVAKLGSNSLSAKKTTSENVLSERKNDNVTVKSGIFICFPCYYELLTQ